MPKKGETAAFDARQMAAFIDAIERGERTEAAAREAGAAVSTVYYRRRMCPAFAAAWDEAKAKSARPTMVTASGGRRLVRKKGRAMPFGRDRKQAFLNHFAGGCNLEAAAKAVNVGLTTVYRHLKSDPAFAEGFQEALEIGYKLLEAEAMCHVREAQQAYRIDPTCPQAKQSFEKTMQLLAEYKRGLGRIGRRPDERRLTRWTFEAAMAALEKKLMSLGYRVQDGDGGPAGEPTPQSPPSQGGEG